MHQENNTFFVGKVLLSFQELSSTNDFALQFLAESHPSEGTVIIAQHQTQGRGQRDTQWRSNAGQNITLSIILYPRFLEARRIFLLNQAIALAVRDCIAQFVPSRVWIKWPNDIYTQSQKIAGILIQNTISKHHLQYAVVGIGMNVLQEQFDTDIPNATSIAQQSSTAIDLSQVQNYLFVCVEQWYLRLRARQDEHIQTSYNQHFYKLEKSVRFQRTDGHIFNGIIKGTDINGKLIIQHESKLENFDIKEIRMLLD